MDTFIPPSERIAIIPSGNKNRTYQELIPKRFVVHATGNRSRGANAEMHRRFVWEGGGNQGVSFTAVVDDTEVIQLLPFNEQGIHGGSYICNVEGESLEICVNEDGDWDRTVHNAAWWIAQRLKARGWDTSNVIRHQQCPSYACPKELIEGQGGWSWGNFIDLIRFTFMKDTDKPVEPEPIYAEPETTLLAQLGEKNHIPLRGARVYRFRDFVQFGIPVQQNRSAYRGSPEIGPDIPAGETVRVKAFVAEANGDKWLVSDKHARILWTDTPTVIL